MDRASARCYPAPMNDLSLTILAETANDAQAIERLHERTFGPGRFVLSAYRLREHVDHLLDLSFTAWIGTLTTWWRVAVVIDAVHVKPGRTFGMVLSSVT